MPPNPIYVWDQKTLEFLISIIRLILSMAQPCQTLKAYKFSKTEAILQIVMKTECADRRYIICYRSSSSRTDV